MVEPETVERVRLLAGLNPAARRELATRAVLRTFHPDAVLWRAGSPAHGLFLLLEGEVRVLRAAGRRTHVVHVEGAGGTLGELPLFRGGTHPATAVASRRTLCLVLDGDAIHAGIRADPILAFRLLERLALRVSGLVERLDRVTTARAGERLAAFLLARSSSSGREPFALGGTQAALAEELGTVREVVVRGLRRLRHAGIIEPAGRGRLRVVDPAALRRAAGGED